MSVTFFNTFPAKKGQGKAFAEMTKKWSYNLNMLPGCSDIKVYIRTDDPDKVVVIEEWESPEAHANFINMLTEKGGMEGAMKLLEEMPQGVFLQRV